MSKYCLLPIVLFSSFQLSASTDAEYNNLFWLSFNSSFYNYLDDSNSLLNAQGNSIGFSHQLSKQWSTLLSYSEDSASGSWPADDAALKSMFNYAETSADALGVSFNWQSELYSLNFSFSNNTTKEIAAAILAREFELIDGKDKVINFSYSRLTDVNEWQIGWQAGLQYAVTNTDRRLISNGDIVTQINARINQKSWSSFVDLDFSYLIVQQNFNWTPQLTISWSEAISTNDKYVIAIIRNGERRIVTPRNDLSASFRLPNSGYWQLSVAFDWNSPWNANISYSQTVASEIDLDSFSIDLSYSF